MLLPLIKNSKNAMLTTEHNIPDVAQAEQNNYLLRSILLFY